MVDVKKAVSGFVEALFFESEDMVLEVVRGFLDGLMEDFGPADLYTAVEKDVSLWENTPSKIRQQAKQMTRKFHRFLIHFRDKINVDTVMLWLREDFPDLWTTIENYPIENGVNKARDWLSRNVATIMAELTGQAQVEEART